MANFEIVETEHGKVKGIHKLSALNTSYISFQGIPYMKAPLGKLRFTDAQEPEKWTNVLDVTEDSPSYCTTNLMTFQVEGQENAAVINVFTKNLNPAKLYPVMVWVHGGGFRFGSSKTDLYGPDYFLQRDVILVSFNYRLGAIGFLSLENESLKVPGNAGLKDQIFALKWIKRNIQNFGGDPNNITLFGESAGAGCIHYLTISELANGLFHRAIIMSGSAFCKRWALIPRDYSKKFTNIFAKKLGYDGDSNDEETLLIFLENVPAFDLMNAHNDVVSNDDQFGSGLWNPFGPIIEPYVSSNCLIDKDSVKMARDAWSKDIDIIFTATSLEGMVLANNKEEVANYYLENPACFAPLLELNLQNTDPIAKEYGEKIKNLYYKDLQQPSVENQYPYLQYVSDAMFWHDIYRSIQSRLHFSQQNTYLLRFHVDGTQNLFKKMFKCEKYKEASHADDLFYLFKSIHLGVPRKESKEFAAIERMIGMFTNFAINGSANCEEIKPVTFDPILIKDDELKCIQITEDDVSEIVLPELPRLKVWNSIYNDHDVALY